MREWNRAQRAVIVVAWGAVLFVLWEWIEGGAWANDGWFNYAPNSGVVFSGSVFQTNPALRLIGQVVSIGLWAAPSVWLLSDRRSLPPDDARRS